ncbi:caspase family protein [Phormidium sp. LEGE 05292]|uniref:nSTAND1 domain-containing NTPase n=1 Tax=[Phormidium] sp. LEGE 05292 TaxID=767427 RepID=UPI00187FACF3|nr:caspase family protein [Phormidium sp. LEGE 05292]MBE9227168.1 caspase family protein [Phormidium sp. LEGE 05292]
MSPISVATSQSKYALKTGSAKLWILLVGVNKYQDSSFPPLEYSALDCQGLSEALTEATQAFPQKEVIIYHDLAAQSATVETVFKSLNYISQTANSQDTVLFYFSGHGLLEPQSQQAFLCFQDTQKDDLVNTGLSLADLLDIFGNCAAHQQLIWLDACHSGGMMLRGSRGKIKTQTNNTSTLLSPTTQFVELLRKRAAQAKGFYALLSCDRAQRSWEFPQLGHGVFTYYLMRGLRGEAADSQGVIDADSLYKYVYHQTLQHIDKTNQQLRLINQQKRHRGETQLLSEYPLQTPKRIVEGVGELILGLKPDTIDLQHSRLALIIDGLPHNENSISLCKVLRQEGNFEVDYLPKPGKAFSEIREAIQLCLRSHSLIRSQLQAKLPPTISKTPDTALLYLRGRIAQTEEGEAWLILGDDIKISRSWLRQELRRSRIIQQIIILDCPGAIFIAEWIEDLQLSPEQGQCLIAATATLEEPEKFTQALLETLNAADKQIGLPAAGWISRLQMYLAGTNIVLHVWLSGTQGIIEILPGNIGCKRIENGAGLDLNLCPYMGLQAFGEEDAQFFHGRETLTQQLVNKLNNSAFLAVIGASGSGKSSVVHAGLISQLKQGKQLPGSEQWWIKSIRPGANPLQALSWRMVDGGTEREKAYQQMELEGILYEGVEGFVRWLRSRPEPMVILIVDQFEELFTLAAVSDKKRFLEIILGALDYASDRFKLVVVLRADFISSCLEEPLLIKALQQSSILVPPYLTKEDYRQAIVMPAEKVGLHIEPQLVEVLLAELNYSAGDLPLLQFVLEQLWLNRNQGKGEITLEVYQQKIGGLKGALERKAQAVFDSLDKKEQDCSKWIFLALTQLGEGKEDTRRRVFKSELIVKKYSSELVERTLQALTTGKLIVMNSESDENVVGRSRSGEEIPLDSQEFPLQEVTVEVAHEALIRHWSTLRWWLEENRARLRVQRQLVQSAMLWKQNKKHSDFLLQGVRLAEAEDIYIKYTDELSEDVQLFIDACLEGRKQQQFQLKKRLRQAKRTIAAISILAMGALSLGSLAYWQSRTAQLKEIEALNSLSENYLLSNKQLEALVTGVKAGRQLNKMMWFGNLIPPTVSKDIQAKTAETLQQAMSAIQERNRLENHSDAVISVAFKHDGQIIASASLDKTINLWSRNGQLIRTLKGHKRGVYSVEFSHNDQTIASASEDKTIKLWRTSDGQLIRTLTGHTREVNSVSFSPDNKTIASASEDKYIKLWRISNGQLIRTLKGNSASVINVSFSPNGQMIVSALADGTIKVWKSSDGQLLKTIKAHNSAVNCVNFSPDGQMIASASADRTIKLWNISNGSLTLSKTLTGHIDSVNSVSFSPNGKYLVSASRDQTIKLWNISGLELQTFRGYSAEVISASFSPDGQTIASASRDNTIRLWQPNLSVLNIQQHTDVVNSVSLSRNGQIIASASDDKTIKLFDLNGRLLKIMLGHTSGVNAVKFSPNDQTIASASQDKTVKIWRVSDGSLLKTFNGHTDEVMSASFSLNGQTIASASSDKTIKIWRISDGTLLKTLRGHTNIVTSVSFSPDGQTIASGSRDKTVKLWKASDGSLLKTIPAHTNWVTNVSFSPDGQMIASASEDKTVKLCDRKGRLLSTLKGHDDVIWEVIFSPNSQIVASVSEDKTIKLWHRDGRLLITLLGYKAGVTSGSFSPDGKDIIFGSRDGTVKLMRIESEELKNLLMTACNWLDDYLQTNNNISQEDKQLCVNSKLQKNR